MTALFTRAALSIGSGIIQDVQNRIKYYKSDWEDIRVSKLRVLAGSIYIFFASLIPALAFGQQFASETNGLINAVHVLTACAVTGVLQALVGGQPLLIVGVAEPIVLVYKYMFDFAKGKSDLGQKLFLAWSAWVCVFAAIFIFLLAITNACVYINRFTRFAGEAFGALIAILFMQQAIKGTIDEFRDTQVDSSSARLINGLWSLYLAFGILLTSLLIRTARKWRFLFSPLRALLADYGVPVLVVCWTGVSYAVSYYGVPERVETPNTWQVTETWKVSQSMSDVPQKYIGAAVIPAIIIAVLFYFDHNVSSQLAQQPEFNLKKPSTYHYDMVLLALMTLVCGLIGIPPVNGVIPQSPMHTKSLSTVTLNRGKKGQAQEEMTNKDTREGMNGVVLQEPQDSKSDIPIKEDLLSEEGLIPLQVVEQRGSGLLQSLLIGCCLGITPAIRWIPRAVLWGFFAFMAIESLPGSQLWDRTLLLLTDPKRRYTILETSHAPYLETVPFKVIAGFTLLQITIVGGIYGLTWAGLAGVLFPIPIMLLVPFRQFIMPRIFNKTYLEELDRTEEEAADPLSHEEAIREAEELGLGHYDAASPQILEHPEDVLETEIAHHRIVHHTTHDQVLERSFLRRRSTAQHSGTSEARGDAGTLDFPEGPSTDDHIA